jgi:hypothetical protein
MTPAEAQLKVIRSLGGVIAGAVARAIKEWIIGKWHEIKDWLWESLLDVIRSIFLNDNGGYY